jgi:O-antigen/teichoic acid export membrane protein
VNKSKEAVHGVKWNYISMVGQISAQVLFVAFLARLLEPAAFGLMAITNLMVKFGQYLSGSGIRSYLIQKDELGISDIHASFFLSGLLGLVFSLTLFFLAPTAEVFFKMKGLEPIIQIMAVSYVFTGLTITSSSLLQRSLHFKTVSLIEVSVYILGNMLVAVPMAFLGYGVYSLVVSTLVQHFLIMSAMYFYSRHGIGVSFDREVLKHTFLPATHYSINSILDYIVNSMATFLVGRWFGENILGIFNRANMLISLPLNSISMAITRVFFPFLSSLKGDRDKLKSVYVGVNTIAALILVPACLCMTSAASELVLVILGDKWIEGVKVFQVLAIGMMFHFVSIYPGQYADAHKLLRWRTLIQVLTIIMMFSFMWSFSSNGMVGVALGFLIGQVFRFFIYAYLIKKWLLFGFLDYLQIYLPGILLGIISASGIWFVHNRLQTFPPLLTLFIEVIVGMILYFFSMRYLQLRDMKNVLRSLERLFLISDNPDIISKILRNFLVKLGK